MKLTLTGICAVIYLGNDCESICSLFLCVRLMYVHVSVVFVIFRITVCSSCGKKECLMNSFSDTGCNKQLEKLNASCRCGWQGQLNDWEVCLLLLNYPYMLSDVSINLYIPLGVVEVFHQTVLNSSGKNMATTTGLCGTAVESTLNLLYVHAACHPHFPRGLSLGNPQIPEVVCFF